MKRFISVLVLITTVLVMFGLPTLSAELSYKLDFDKDAVGSEEWFLQQTTYFDEGRLIMALTEGTEDKRGYGLISSKKAFNAVTFKLDIENLVPNEGPVNYAYIGLRLPTAGSLWYDGLWFGFKHSNVMKVKANSAAEDGIDVNIPVNFSKSRKVIIEDNGNDKVTVYANDDKNKKILLASVGISDSSVKVYDASGALAGEFDTSLSTAGGYLGVMTHYVITAVDNLEVSGTELTLDDIIKSRPAHKSNHPAAVGGTPVNEVFTDIANVEWAWEGIAALNARGALSGTSATTFDPDGVLTREQFIKLAAGAFDLVDENSVATFSDVREGEWYYSYVASAQKLGFLDGIYQDNLGVGQPISRQDMTAIAKRMFDYKKLTLSPVKEPADFADSQQIASYALEAVNALYEAGIINGVTETTFAPGESCTRAMAAKILYGLLAYYPNYAGIRDTMSDTWVGVDQLGRVLLTSDKTRAYRTDKTIGMFYYIWQDNVDYILNSAEELAKPVSERNWQAGKTYWAQEPYFGYYRPTDEYVIRKNMQMLADAGVDFIFFDATNNTTRPQQSVTIMKVLREMMNEGIKVPKVCYAVHTNQQTTIREIYMNIYGKGLYPETWFYWEGKPLILADPDNMPEGIEDFFTAKESWAYGWGDWWNDGTHGKNKWPWLAAYPQPYGWDEDPSKPEQLVIAAAQHADSNIGKSYHDGAEEYPWRTDEGLYFAEQISRLDEVDPEVVMFVQWNEKIAGIQKKNGPATMGVETNAEGYYFIDAMAEEYNRDMEPVRGSYGDNYYYQMVNAARKFKGVRPAPETDKSHTVAINKDFGQWAKVEEIYYDDVYDIPHRNDTAVDPKITYTETSGRNDVIEARTARDGENLYFYVKTRNNITTATDSDKMHMVLYLNTDGDYKTGWHGYDYIVGRARKDGFLSVEKCTATGNWQWKVVAKAQYVTQGNEKHLCIAKSDIGIFGEQFTVDFKWADNQPETPEIMEFIDKGEAAPNGRFNYRFTAK